MAKLNYYFSKNRLTMVPFNRWDIIALVLILGTLVLLAVGSRDMTEPFHVGETIPISLSPTQLPYYALRSILRILFALIASLIFTLVVGAMAAKNRHFERFAIPAIDILQSVPVLGFLSITVVGFIQLFHGSLLGPELASIFVIFTAQVWNMTLSFYQSLKTIPNDLIEACKVYQLNAWQRFWKLEVPFAMPALLWNTMMSVSASWFFVVASEAINVASYHIELPGVGSYIAEAIIHADKHAILYAILTMLLVILLYDQLLFRPLIVWADKFKLDTTGSELQKVSLLTELLKKTHAIKYLSHFVERLSEFIVNLPFLSRRVYQRTQIPQPHTLVKNTLTAIWYVGMTFAVGYASYALYRFIRGTLPELEIAYVAYLGFLTALRVAACVLISSLIWLPLGVWIGLRARAAELAQPILQFFAAFPAYLLFPVISYFIFTLHLNVQTWVIVLMLLGTQWYIAFNVIAGTAAIPKDLHLVASNFGLSTTMRWKRLILPAIFPYYVTGSITAVGGAWNVSIVAEVISWGNQNMQAKGLGAYITYNTVQGDFPRIALGIAVMCIYVLIFNHLIWQPLYNLAERKFRMEQ